MILSAQKLGPKLTRILIGFLAITLAAIGLTLLASWHLEGGAGAINDAGSLRMRSYRIAYTLSEGKSGRTEPAALRAAIDPEVQAFEDTVAGLLRGDPSRPLLLPDNPEIQARMQRIAARWRDEIKPLIYRTLDASDAAEIDRLLTAYHPIVDRYVSDVNALVAEIEREDTRNTILLRGYQFVLIATVLIGVVVLVYLMYLLIVRPVGKLQEGIERMTNEDFAARVPVETQDEFGALASGFNRMADHLESLYATLEQRVQSKTRTLEQTNRELAALYETTTLLNEPLIEEELCRGFVKRLIAFCGADGAAVRLLSPGSKHIHLFVHEGLARSAANDGHCIAGGECACCEAAQSQSPIVRRLQPVQPLHTTCERGDYRTIAAFTIQAQNKLLGIFNLYFRDEHLLDAPEQQLFETLGRHLGTALENQRLVARDKELAVSDERNLLAQELHDSIAQSLAFLNIQAQLLQEALRAGQTQQATESVKQIREGIQESYDDVRELLVHFRTRVDHADIEQALRTTLEKFEGQTGIKTSFEQSGLGIALSPEQELQALHIVQEALSNVRKHARASAVALSLRRGPEYAFCIRDNGAGFDPQATIGPADSHVGLKIMRERAHRIGGSLAIKSAPGHGTEVTLTLPVAQREAA